ncbi:PDZ domain-containing protein [Melghirimyces profundicolus]|uniref:endopeptidase La n=1 Tax=Melghirimyces profundicolus TaxID=1242148 RepID=A0A2T6BYX4_9BACL|nr:SepM family pheromone-processing serine protease [Melghirimyces profundicolus]PTX61246.1 PDZ domain-containing protein [Melghirimyces profundicolus]
MKNPKPWYRRTWVVTGLAVAVLFAILFMVPVPYYIVQPGSALEVRPMIRVEGTETREKGGFFMTTVSMREGNVLGILASRLDPRFELVPKDKVLMEGEDPEDYQRRQVEIMDRSQQNAVLAAFRETGKKVKEKLLGVRVFRVLKEMPAEKVLKEGDLITKVDGKKVRSSEELIAYLKGKSVGDKVQLQVKRKGDILVEEVKLGNLGKTGTKERPGIGIEPVTERKIQTDPKVTVQADDIGGPSAGLMFTLEIINQLTNGNLTHGYRVAGTGTITPEGKVGQIGGIQHKIIAAEEENVDIFFVPADTHPGDSNEKRAKETARKIGADLKLVPVENLEDALTFLEKQERKNQAS